MNDHRPSTAIVTCLFILGLADAAQCGERDRDSWARFRVGSWKQMRVVRQTLTDKGEVASTSSEETKTILQDVDENGYTLHVETRITVGGQTFKPVSQPVHRGFDGEINGETAKVAVVGEDKMTINGRVVPFELREIVYEHDGKKRISRVCYSPDLSPHTLKQVVTSHDDQGKQTGSTVSEVLAVEMPHCVKGEIHRVAHVRTVREHPQGSETFVEFHSDQIPGGVAYQASTSCDKNGRVLSRTTTELVDYAEPTEAAARQTSQQRRATRGRLMAKRR